MPALLHTLSQCSTPFLLESLLQLKSSSLSAAIRQRRLREAIGLELQSSEDDEENAYLLPDCSNLTR